MPVSTDVLARLRVVVRTPRGDDWTSELDLRVEPIPSPGIRDERKRVDLHTSGPRIDVHDVDTGGYRAWVTSTGRRSTTVEFELAAAPAPVKEVELVLEPAGVLRGRLVDGKGGVLDGLALLWHSNLTLDRGEERGGLDGRFVISGILDGSYTLIVGPELDPIRRFDALEHHGVETDLGDVVISGLGMLRITVRDPSGAPVASARVWEAGPAPHFELSTDERGQCIARHLPAGQYRVFAHEKFHGEANQPVKLDAGVEGDLELVLPR